MKAWLRLLAWTAAGALVSFGACSNDVETSSSATSTGDTTSGSGGSGGAPTTTSSSSAGGGDVVLTCPNPTTTFKDTQCDFLNQNCPFGEACIPVTYNGNTTTKCEPWTGVKPEGAPCVTHEECKPGLFCGFYCAPPCCRMGDQPCMGAGCNFSVSFDGNQRADICNYAPKCDPFVLDKCDDEKDCHFDSKQRVAICVPITGKVDKPTEGKDCNYLNDCDEMQICNDSKKCVFSCDVNKQSEPPGLGGCMPNQKCVQYVPEVMIYPTLGYCVPD